MVPETGCCLLAAALRLPVPHLVAPWRILPENLAVKDRISRSLRRRRYRVAAATGARPSHARLDRAEVPLKDDFLRALGQRLQSTNNLYLFGGAPDCERFGDVARGVLKEPKDLRGDSFS